MAVIITTVMITNVAMIGRHASILSRSAARQGAQVDSLVADVFRKGGWRVLVQPERDRRKPDLLAERAGKKYIIEIKRSSEGRRDRLVPLMAQALLEVKNLAHHLPGRPVRVAIVVANHIPESVAEQIKNFAREHAPDIAIGVMDLEGFRSFEGQGLEELSSERPKGNPPRLSSPGSPQLFSDLNQWMLKVLLAPAIPDSFLSAPRGRYEGASQLAQASGVSMMSAFRFVEQFSKEGFLEQEGNGLRLVRVKELMERWLGASQGRTPQIAVRWILRRGHGALREALGAYISAGEKLQRKSHSMSTKGLLARRPRACLGLFAAAEALGVGFVHGVQPYLYIEGMEPDALESLGLSGHGAEQHADVYIRIPRNRESVFRAAIVKDGVPVSDVLQVWLDAAQHPSRGREQADLIWRKILAPSLLSKSEQ
jgi:hypothetical protein